MRTYIIWQIVALMIPPVSTIPYDQLCTFSSDRCQWNSGRRWAIGQFDDEIDDQVLMAMGHSEDDEQLGYTDSISTSWLTLSPICAFNIRLGFLFNIENEHDRLEAFLWKKNGTRISSIGQWTGLSNVRMNLSDERESHWQQANLTFQAAEQFRIEIEVRHRPNERNQSTSWFAIDDLLIERCPNVVQVTSTKATPVTTVSRPWATPFYRHAENWTGFNRSFYRFRWKFNDSTDPSSSIDDLVASTPRFTFLNVVLYISCAVVGLALLIILLATVISVGRKHCLPPTTSSPSVIHYRYRSSRKKKTHRLNKHPGRLGRDTRTEKTMITTLRTNSWRR